ncbi:hypothetical protein SLEP1_g59255 [Rubroshorea leprosula]|uniref:Uncharacterized protein n=1 Tax=Rubroshorea leprosula TaxID=152421 RepID=A0AAV5MU96_9ROSI|nr:hypothetical protein SLEP1_g59255 [Rubroshorea leprosula]
MDDRDILCSLESHSQATANARHVIVLSCFTFCFLEILTSCLSGVYGVSCRHPKIAIPLNRYMTQDTSSDEASVVMAGSILQSSVMVIRNTFSVLGLET